MAFSCNKIPAGGEKNGLREEGKDSGAVVLEGGYQVGGP